MFLWYSKAAHLIDAQSESPPDSPHDVKEMQFIRPGNVLTLLLSPDLMLTCSLDTRTRFPNLLNCLLSTWTSSFQISELLSWSLRVHPDPSEEQNNIGCLYQGSCSFSHPEERWTPTTPWLRPVRQTELKTRGCPRGACISLFSHTRCAEGEIRSESQYSAL